MASILSSLRATVISGFVLALIVVICLSITGSPDSGLFLSWLFRWFHVLSGIMWIGLLYYFNFVQIPNMGKIPDDQKPAIGKVIAPSALFWFRWAALSTIVTGIIVASLNGYFIEALTFRSGSRVIGLGMWLGAIMAFNVWFVIWPNQKRVLGITPADDATKAKSARTAMLFSRTNTLLSVPMLVCMIVPQNIFF